MSKYDDDTYCCVWADGSYCSMFELEEHLQFMSDDYEIITWDELEERGLY